MRAKALPEMEVESAARTVAVPAVARKIFTRILIRVVLPAPFGPTSAWTPPCATRRLNSSRAFKWPKRLERDSVSMAKFIGRSGAPLVRVVRCESGSLLSKGDEADFARAYYSSGEIDV